MSAEDLRKKIEERRKRFEVAANDLGNEDDKLTSRAKRFGKVFNDSIKGSNKFSSIEVTNDIKIDEETIHKRKEKFKVNDNETDANLGLNHYADMNKKGHRGRGGRQSRQGRLRLAAPGRDGKVLRRGLRLGVNNRRSRQPLENSLTASRQGRRPRFNNSRRGINIEGVNVKRGIRRYERKNFDGNRRSNFRGGRFSNFRNGNRRNRY